MSIEYIADVASILTFLGGLFVYVQYRWGMRRRSKRLEEYLRNEKRKGNDQGQRSILNIVRYVGLTQEEIIQASFQNPRIGRRVATDPQTGIASSLLFEYEAKPPN